MDPTSDYIEDILSQAPRKARKASADSRHLTDPWNQRVVAPLRPGLRRSQAALGGTMYVVNGFLLCLGLIIVVAAIVFAHKLKVFDDLLSKANMVVAVAGTVGSLFALVGILGVIGARMKKYRCTLCIYMTVVIVMMLIVLIVLVIFVMFQADVSGGGSLKSAVEDVWKKRVANLDPTLCSLQNDLQCSGLFTSCKDCAVAHPREDSAVRSSRFASLSGSEQVDVILDISAANSTAPLPCSIPKLSSTCVICDNNSTRLPTPCYTALQQRSKQYLAPLLGIFGGTFGLLGVALLVAIMLCRVRRPAPTGELELGSLSG